MCGPFRTISLGGSKYFVTITDDYSRRTWKFFLKNESNTFAVFKEFHQQTDKGQDKTHSLRMDRTIEEVSSCQQTSSILAKKVDII